MIWLLLGCIGALSDRYVFGQDPNDSGVDWQEDTGPRSTVDCDQALSTEAPATCESSALHCGDVLHATTEGGRSDYSDLFYETAYCFVPYESYGSPERVYELQLQDQQQIDVVLASPCRAMALAVARWEETETCPPEQDHQILECEGFEAGHGGRVTLSSPGGGRYLVIVEGPPANFELRIECP